MMSLACVLCIILGVVVLFMGFQGLNAGWKRLVPRSYRVTYMVLYVCYVVWSMYLARKIISNSSDSTIVAALLIAFVMAAMLFVPSILVTRQGVIRKISFKNTLIYGIQKKATKEYQKLNPKEFAEQNNMEYMMVVSGNRIENDEDIERIVAKDNKYIKFYPYNDGYTYSPKKEWFGKFEKDGEVYYAKIMDGKTAFSGITNLKEILLQMTQLYWDSIEKDLFMDPYEFALMLEDEPTEGYTGRAKLVITADTIKNRKIEVDEKEKARRYYVNRFLDCFIGWNFGAIVNDDLELRVRLKQLNELVTLKDMRNERRPGNKLEFNEYIQRYQFKNN